jgi:hypothetical protein
VHCRFAIWLSWTSFESHGAGDKLARLPPLGLLDLTGVEFPGAGLLELLELLELAEVLSAGSEMNGRKLHFLSPPF